MFSKKKVVATVLFVLVLSLSALTVFANDAALDGWQWSSDGGQNVSFYRDGARVVGVQNVPVPPAWWHYSFGVMPANPYRYFLFDADGVKVRGAGWVEVDGNRYHFAAGHTLAEGWLYCPEANIVHYMLPAMANSNFVLATNIPANWSYDADRVTHRWFNFGADGAIIQDATTDGWVNGAFFFGHGVTQGWVYDAGYVFYFGATPTFATGTQSLNNPWTNDVRPFAFGANGEVSISALWNYATEYAVESFLPGITFVIIEGVASDRAVRVTAGNTVLREDALYAQPGGGFRIALEGEFTPAQVELEIFG